MLHHTWWIVTWYVLYIMCQQLQNSVLFTLQWCSNDNICNMTLAVYRGSKLNCNSSQESCGSAPLNVDSSSDSELTETVINDLHILYVYLQLAIWESPHQAREQRLWSMKEWSSCSPLHWRYPQQVRLSILKNMCYDVHILLKNMCYDVATYIICMQLCSSTIIAYPHHITGGEMGVVGGGEARAPSIFNFSV